MTEFYNHISNGGYTFSVGIKNRVQYLKITLTSFGAKQSTKITLNENVLDTLQKVIDEARLQRTETDDLNTWIEELIRSDNPTEELGECDSCSSDEEDEPSLEDDSCEGCKNSIKE